MTSPRDREITYGLEASHVSLQLASVYYVMWNDKLSTGMSARDEVESSN